MVKATETLEYVFWHNGDRWILKTIALLFHDLYLIQWSLSISTIFMLFNDLCAIRSSLVRQRKTWIDRNSWSHWNDPKSVLHDREFYYLVKSSLCIVHEWKTMHVVHWRVNHDRNLNSSVSDYLIWKFYNYSTLYSIHSHSSVSKNNETTNSPQFLEFSVHQK